MRRTTLSACALIFLVVVGAGLWPSCRGETAAASQLPAPESDDRTGGSAPERPRLSVELPKTITGPVHAVASGADLQSAIDAASPGDVIVLEPGVVYEGPITLPDKN